MDRVSGIESESAAAVTGSPNKAATKQYTTLFRSIAVALITLLAMHDAPDRIILSDQHIFRVEG